ncbi:MAG: alpha/beta hydrolase [Pseudomonadota bacterium]
MSAKPCVYLLPGLMCDEAIWKHQRVALEKYADVRIPVFRGFNTLRAMADYVLEDAPERFSVVGHSMGGRVAFELMEIAGKRIERFAVMDTGVHGVQGGEAEKRGILLAAATRKGLQEVADEWIPPMLHPDNRSNEQLVDDINQMILRNTIDDYRGQVAALLARNDQTPYLARIKQKTWLLCGEADSWSPVSQHEAMQPYLAASELRIIKNAGHMSPMEQPDAVSSILVEWINE